MVYAIYESFWNDVEKKLKRVVKKCVKHGNDFIYEIKGEEIRKVIDNNKHEHYYKFILVDVEGTAKIDNWECIAVLEIYREGNVIRRINTEIEVPERFKTSANICEHCNSKRHRKQLFVIHNVETDEWKQVGGDCLKLYTNGLSVEYVAAFMDGITKLEENDGFVGEGRDYYYSVEKVLSYADTIISKTGYFNAESDNPTKNLVKDLCFYPLENAIRYINKDLKKFHIEFDRHDFFTEATDKRVEAIIDYYKGLEADTEFMHNIRVMLSEGFVKSTAIGFLTYLPEGYNRYIQKEVEREKNLKQRNLNTLVKLVRDIKMYQSEA